MSSNEKNLVLICGSDAATIAKQAEKRVKEVAGENADPFALDIIRQGEDQSTVETVNELIRSILSPPFLGGRKTVWLQHFSGFGSEGTKQVQTAEAKAFRKLAEVIKDGLPEDIFLVMDGTDIDKRKSLYLACKSAGIIEEFEKPDVRSRNWEDHVRKVIQSRAQDLNVSLPSDVVVYLVDVVGTETERIDVELEKLICYCGGVEQQITLEAAQQVCPALTEVLPWALLDSLGKRKANEALQAVDLRLREGKEPEGVARGLLLQVANFFRQLLQIRVFMHEKGVRSEAELQRVVENLPATERQTSLEDGFEFIQFHPYRARMLAQQALNYSGPELVQSIGILRDAYLKAVTGASSVRVVLENAILQLLNASVKNGNR